jgi:hypothetical protein
LSRGISNISNLFNRVGETANTASGQYFASREASINRTYESLTAELSKNIGKIKGASGKNIDDQLKKFLGDVRASGGSNIKTSELNRLMGELSKGIGKSAASMTGIEGQLARELTQSIRTVKKEVKEEGLSGYKGKSLKESTQKADINQKIDDGRAELTRAVRGFSKTIGDPAIKKQVDQIRGTFHRRLNTATSVEDKKKAYEEALRGFNKVKASTTNEGDKEQVDKIVDSFSEFKKGLFGTKSNLWAARLRAGFDRTTTALGAATKVLIPLKKTFDVGNAIFQQVNNKFNQFARTQMRIAGERGAFGRIMRGAGMDYSSMMSALGTGRRAGMDDREVVNKMVSMQEQLARARWGEGPMIENLGKWGLTPFDENGNMKDFNRVMIDISNKFNTLGSEMERLQFLSMQGFRPEQMEYVKNYAKDAKAWAELKKHPERMGVLEQSRYLDESGLYAKVDAATKIELKRRQMLNQNAIDEGVWEGLKRSLHPENWFFEDWTARKKGVESAKSEIAMEGLRKELERAREELRKNNQGVNKLSGNILNLDPSQLMGLALQGGAAQADIDNRGEQSSVYALRKLYAKELGLEDLRRVEERNKVYNSAIGVGGGALGGAAVGAIIGSVIPILGTTIGAILGAALGGTAGGVGMYSQHIFDIAEDGVNKHIEKLKSLRGQPDEIRKYLDENKIYGLSPEVVESKEFDDDKVASRYIQSGYRSGLYMEAQSLTNKNIDISKAHNYTDDRFYKANKQAAELRGEELSRERTVEAIARMGTGDETIGIDSETAYNYITYGLDKSSQEYKTKRFNKIGQIRGRWQKEKKKFTEKELQKAAEEEVEQDFKNTISPNIIRAAEQYQGVSKDREGTWRHAIKQAGLREGAFANGGERAIESLRKQIKTIEEVGVSERNSEEYSGLKKVLEILTTYGSKENFLQSSPDIKKMVFGDGEIPFAYKSLEEQKAEINRMISVGDERKSEQGLTLGARLARFARKSGTSIGTIRDALLSDEEVSEIERKEAAGEDLDEGTKEKWEQYKKGGKYKARQAKQEAEKKNVEQKKQQEKEEKEIDEELTRRYEGPGELSGEISGDKKTLTDRDIEVMRKANAKYGALEKGFSANEISQFEENEQKRKETFSKIGLGDEDQYEEFKNIEDRVLKGEDVEKGELDFYTKTKEKLDKATVRAKATEYKPLNEEYVLTAEEAAAREATSKSIEIGEKAGAEMRSRGDLNKMSDLNRIDDFVKKGWSKKKIQQNFGKDRLEEYEAAVKVGTYEDHEAKRQEKARDKFEKENRASLKATGMSDESIEQVMTQKMDEYDAEVERKRKAKADREAAQMERERKNGIGSSGFPIDEDGGTIGSSEDATRIMQEKEAGVAQVVDKLEEVGSAAEFAASTAKNANGEPARGDNGVTINMGGQNITQNIQGTYPMDQDGMKRGTLQGAEEICEMAVQHVTDAVNSIVKSSGSY